MSTSPADFHAQIIEEFRANQGRVGGMFEGATMLLLHHIGAKSGTSRINPLVYQSDEGRYVVFASKGGAPMNPDWYHNLKAHPSERLFRTQAERGPQFADYQNQTERVFR